MGISCGFICGMPVPMKKTLPFRAEPFFVPGRGCMGFPSSYGAAIGLLMSIFAWIIKKS